MAYFCLTGEGGGNKKGGGGGQRGGDKGVKKKGGWGGGVEAGFPPPPLGCLSLSFIYLFRNVSQCNDFVSLCSISICVIYKPVFIRHDSIRKGLERISRGA